MKVYHDHGDNGSFWIANADDILGDRLRVQWKIASVPGTKNTLGVLLSNTAYRPVHRGYWASLIAPRNFDYYEIAKWAYWTVCVNIVMDMNMLRVFYPDIPLYFCDTELRQAPWVYSRWLIQYEYKQFIPLDLRRPNET
jgi:hypothetical protein